MAAFTPEEVRKYYNTMTTSYLEIYGDVIQAFRPGDTDRLLDYIGRSAGINWGMNVLDLGCGVGGPAIYFAKKWNVQIDGVTVSEVQKETADKKIADNLLSGQISIYQGDYHQLELLPLKDNQYDIILFLESLGHSYDVAAALKQAALKLKKGGCLYIKDFYKKQVQDEKEQQKIDRAIANIDHYYAYNTLDLEKVLSALEDAGLQVLFAKPFDFADDISVRYAFEQKNGIEIFEGQPEFYPAEWLEIRCIKP
ncbi:MAG: class I SAM-dependent methyltransferase [Chitinophagales bacterium]